MSMLVAADVQTGARTLLHHLNVARMRTRFLPARHPSVQQTVHETHALLTALLGERETLVLVLYAGEFFVNEVRLARESLVYDALREALDGAGVHAVRVERGVTEVELTAFFDACFAPRTGVQGSDEATRAALHGSPHISINADGLDAGVARQLGPISEALGDARESYHLAVRAVVEAYYDSKQRRNLNTSLVQRIVLSLQEGLNTNPDLFLAMSQLRDVSEYTFFHSVNVAIVSMLLGKRIGLSPGQVNRLGVAAMLHDVGKAHVPLEILDKPASLDTQEREIVEHHPVESLRILSEQKDIHPSAVAVALQHHVRFDCSGYPDFKGFGELHFFSHIATIADVYDALRSNRSYKPAMLPDTAMEIMLQGMGQLYHPTLMKAFFQLVGFYPSGSLVELDTGEYAVVQKSNPRAPMRPVVKLLTPLAGAGVTFRMIDLNQTAHTGYYPRNIMRAIDPAQYGIRIAGLL